MSNPAQNGSLHLELGRRYHFSASHRLHSPHLTEEENYLVYGRCNNPFGHGHNYVLEVAVSGNVDAGTGMITNLSDLDEFVETAVLRDFDHKSLNEEVPAFQKVVPTTENICIEIFQRLKSFPKAKLKRVHVEETSNNSFEYFGDNAEGNQP